jgi:hypothetical protein
LSNNHNPHGTNSSKKIPLASSNKGTCEKINLAEGERGYWKSFRAVPFHLQVPTKKNLDHFR